MRLLITLFSLWFFFINNVVAQNQLEHAQKTYTSSDGRLYVNKNQPIYLFIGATPDASNLQKLSSQQSPQSVNPLYFEKEGRNAIRTPSQVDPITKKVVMPEADIIFDVYADGISPKSSAKFLNATRFLKEGKVIYGNNLVVNLKTFDEVSGIDKLYYSIDGGPYKTYKDSLSFEQEKDYELKFYGVDHVGNVEQVNEYAFVVDKTAPTVSWEIVGNANKDTLSGNAKIKLSAFDDVAGVKHLYYQIDEKPAILYTTPISLSQFSGGGHSFKFFAIDNVANSSDRNSDGEASLAAIKDFIIDNTPPKATFLVIGDYYKNGSLEFISPRTRLKLDGEDDMLFIDRVQYSINSTDLKMEYSEPFKFEEIGKNIVWYQAVDMVENKSSIQQKSFYVDGDAPVSGITYKNPKFFARDTLFIGEDTDITIFSKDHGAGVKEIDYKIDNGNFIMGSTLKLTGGGYHKIEFKSLDNVNNEEVIKTSEVVVDVDGPEVFVRFSIKSIRQEVVDGETIEVYPPYVNMYIGATDRYCGTQSIFYTIDGGIRRDYSIGSNPSDVQMFNAEKIYTVLVEAYDKLGNKGSKNIRFRIANR